MMFWGKPAQPGSLCNLREIVRRVQVDKGVKVFNVGDEFLMHAFRAHLTAGILTQLKLTSTSDPLEHTESSEWLHQTAQKLVTTLLMPVSAKIYTDKIHGLVQEHGMQQPSHTTFTYNMEAHI